jgi:hypothetical protein
MSLRIVTYGHDKAIVYCSVKDSSLRPIRLGSPKSTPAAIEKRGISALSIALAHF